MFHKLLSKSNYLMRLIGPTDKDIKNKAYLQIRVVSLPVPFITNLVVQDTKTLKM